MTVATARAGRRHAVSGEYPACAFFCDLGRARRAISGVRRRTSCSKLNRAPVCVYGFEVYGQCLYFNFLATAVVNRFMKTLTRYARAYMDEVSDRHFDLRHLVAVWKDIGSPAHG